MNDVEEYYLQHAGVKGMKWGVRKKRSLKTSPKQRRSKTPNEKKEPAKEYDKAFEKGSKRGKQAKRVSQAIDTASALAYSAFVTAAFFRMANPQAYTKASNIVDSAIKGAGLYAKYAAQSATPSRYTIKARDIINAAVVNAGNEVGFVR